MISVNDIFILFGVEFAELVGVVIVVVFVVFEINGIGNFFCLLGVTLEVELIAACVVVDVLGVTLIVELTAVCDVVDVSGVTLAVDSMVVGVFAVALSGWKFGVSITLPTPSTTSRVMASCIIPSEVFESSVVASSIFL